MLSPIERINTEFKDDEDANTEEFSRVKAIITEIDLKTIPKEIVAEAVQKSYDDPTKVMLLIMIKYQPGSRREKEALLQQISCPEFCGSDERAPTTLKMCERRIERAQELKLVIPDPSVLLSGLDTIIEKEVTKDQRRSFRIESVREDIKVDVITSFEAVEKLALLLESELDRRYGFNVMVNRWTQGGVDEGST